MTSRVSLGLVGLLPVALLVGGAVLGRAVSGGVGAVLGLVVGFALSGMALRAYFVGRDAASSSGREVQRSQRVSATPRSGRGRES